MPGGKGNINGNDGVRFSATDQPANRRKSMKFLTDLLTKNLKKKQEITIEGIDTITGKTTKIKVPMPTKEVVVQALLRQAAKGNMIAIKEIFDRTEGKSVQSIAMTDKDGEDIITPFSDAQVNEILKSLRENKST